MLRQLTTLLPVLFWLSSPAAAGAAVPQGRSDGAAPLTATLARTPPVIDGALDDEAWSAGPLALAPWLSYNPVYGDRLSHETQVWAAYDDRFLYFAFRCTDPEPARIRTAVRKRDALFNDDWVGLSLDSLGSKQTSYDMFVNPSGMQADILTNNASGESVDPDWVWDSAGRLTATGYEVELRIPLESVRFKGGSRVTMGVVFWRRVSRLGVSVAWPDLPPGKSVFERSAALVFENLRERTVREAIPSATYAVNQERATPGSFAKGVHSPDVGITARYGITSSMTVEGTVNPDFSQVESDAFQVTVNQRYPVFYSEKRPFFMEGSGIFSLAGPGSDSNMMAAVHTRRIVDPIGGLKFTGTAGKVTFGVLSASDESPGRASDAGTPNPYEGRNQWFHVARVQRALRGDSYVGAIVADSEFGGGVNRVVGADASIKLDDHQRIGGMALYTTSQALGAGARTGGAAGHVYYSYDTRRFNLGTFAEHYDDQFRMDVAFYNQAAITAGWIYSGLNFYPDKTRYGWLKRVTPFVFVQRSNDGVAHAGQFLFLPGLRMNFLRQGFFRVDRFFGHEPWAGRTFSLARWRLMGNGQVLKWLNVDGRYTVGDATYYDPESPFGGRMTQPRLSVTFEPTPSLSLNVAWSYTRFDRVTGERVYDVTIVNSRTTYQFTKQFFLRAIAQYDSQRQRVLTDALASYELRPGTVVYAGYGSLVDKRAYEDGEWIPGRGSYSTSHRSLFFKTSYLLRF
jgi:hypothetical protein